MKTTTHKIIIASMFAALVCIATMIIKIPSPLKGFINIGDCIVLLCSWIMTPFYGFFAAGIGSALADIFSGYILYAPATFIIKGLMVLVSYASFKHFSKKLKPMAARIISGISAEAVMIAGYYVFEGFMYGFVPSLVNLPANFIQGFAGLVLGLILIRIFKKNNITF